MSARVLPLCAAALAWAAVATAAPLDLAAVPAKAQWLMHFDMDAARESTVVKRAWERVVKMHPHAEPMLKMGAGMMGMDLQKDLRDVTAWGVDTDKRNGVMIVRAKANREFLERMVEKAPDHETMEHRKYTLHSWTHKGWKGHKGKKVVGAFHRDDVIVFAQGPEQVEAALDVLDGEMPSAVGEGPLAGRVRPGSIIVARAAAVDPDTKCPVLKQGRSFRVAMGESDGTSFYRARLEMQSDEAADDLEDVIEGMEALARLRFGDDAAVIKLVEGLEMKTQGSTCTVSWDAPADEVWAVMEKMAKHWEQKQREWMRAHGGKRGCACGDRCGCGKSGCKGCDKCPAECPIKGGRPKNEGALRDDEF